MKFIEKAGSFLIDLIKYGSPIFMVIFSIIVVAGIIKWGYRIQDSLRLIFKNPIYVIVWICAFSLGMFLLVKYVFPLF